MPRKSTTKGSSTDTSKKLTLLLDRPIKVYFQDLNITIEIIGDAIYINNPSKKEIPDAFFNTEYFQTISRRKINYVFREYTLGNSLPQRISDRVYKIGNKHTLGDLLKSIKDNKGSLYSMKDVSNTYIDVENSENIKKTLDDCKKDNFTQSGRPVLESKYDSALKTLSVTLLPEYMNQDGITELKTQILDQIQVKTMDIQSVSFIYQHTFMGRIVNDIISINIGTTDKSKRTEAFLNVMNGIKIENISKNSIPDFLVEVDNAKTKSSRTQAKTILGNQALTPEVISNVCILTTEEDYFNSEENIKSVLSGLSKIPYKDKSIKKLNIKTTKGRDNVIDLSSFSEDKCPDIMKIITDTLSESANFTDILNSNYLKTKNFCILLADGIQKMQDIIAVVPDIVGMGELGKIAYKKYYTAEDSQKCDRILENLKAFQQVLQAAASGSSVFNNYINKINNIDYVAQYVQDNFEKFLDYPPETVKYIFNKIIETSSAIEADTALTTKKQKKEKFLDEMKKVIEEKEAEYQILFDGEVKNIVVFQDVVNEKSTQQYLIYKQEIPTGAVRNDFDKSGAIFYPATEDDLSSTNRDKYNFVVVNKAIADTNKNASFLNSVCKSLNFESGNVIFHDIPEFKDDNGAAKKSVYLSDSNPFEDNQVIKAEEVKSNIGSQFKEKYPETYLQMNGQFYRVMKKHANDKYYNTHATYDEIVSSPNKYIFIPYTTVPTRQYLRISRLSKDNIEFKAEYNQDLCSKSIIQGQCGTEELYIESANVKIKSIGKYDGLNYDPSSIQIDTKEYDLFEYDSKSHTTRYIRPAEPLDYSKKQYVYRNGSDYYSIIYIVDENNTLKYYTKKLDMATDPALEKKLDDIVKTEIESFDVDEIKKRETDNFTEVTIGGETYFVVKKMYSDTAKNKYYALTTDDVKSDDLFKSDDYALVQYKDDKVYKLEQISETTSGIEYKYNKKTAIAQATWLDGQDFDKKIKIDLTNKKISISLDEFVMNDTFDKDTINKFLTTLSQIINNEKSLQEGVSMEYTFGDKKWEITNVDFTFGKTGYKRTYDKVVEIFSSLKEQKAEEKIVEREIEKHKAVHLFNDCFEIQNDTLIIKKIPDQTSLIFNGKEHQDIMMMELLQTYNYNLIDKIKKIKFDLTLPDSSNENQEIDISAIENSIEKKRFISNICLVLGQVSLQTNKTDSSLYLKDKIKQYKDELSSYKSDTDKTLHDELTKVIQDYISDSTNPQIDLSLFEDYLAASIGGREIPIDNTLIKLEHVKQIEQTLSLIQQNLENTVSREEVQKKFDVIQKQLMEDRNLLNCSDDSLKFLQNILQGNNLKIWNFAEKEIVNILEIILNIHKAQDSATKDAELTTFIKNPFDPDPLSGSETCVQYINSYRKKLWEESSLGQTIYSIFKNQEIYQYINLNNAFNFYQDKDRKQLTNFFNALNKEQKEIINCTEGSQLFGLYFNYIPNFPKEEFGYIQDMILYINKVEDINKIIDGINYLTTYNASSRTFYDSYYKHFKQGKQEEWLKENDGWLENTYNTLTTADPSLSTSLGTDYDDFKKSRLFAGGNSIINKYKRDIITELKEYNYSTAHIKHFFTQLINNDDSTIKALQKQSKLLAEERKFIDDLYQDKEDITVLTKKDYSELCNILTSSDIDLKNKIKDPLLKEYIHYSLIQNYDKTDTKDIVEAIKATIENCPQSGKCGITQKILDKASKGDIQNFVSLTYQLNKIYGNNFVIINQYLKNKFATDNTYDIQKASKDLVKMAVGIIFNRQYNIAANFDTISLDIEDARINDDIIKDTIKSLVELNEKDITDINSFKAVYDELSTKLLDKSVELKMEDTAVASPDIYAKFVQTELRQIYSDQFSSTKAPELTSYNIDNYDDVKKVVEECYKVIVLPQINSKPNATFNEYHNILETYIANIKEYIVNCVNEDKSVDKNTIINTCLPNLETFLKLELKDNAGQPLFTVDDIKLLSNESCQNIIKNCTTQSKETDGNKSAIGKSILQNKFLLSSDNAKDSTLYDDIITIISNANLDKAQTFVTSINSSAEFEAVKELCQLYTGIQKYIEDAAIDDAIKNEFNRIYLAIVVASINADKTPQDVLKDLRESVDFKEIYAKLATIKYYRNAYSDIGKNVAVNPLPEEIVTAVKNTLQEKDISIEKFNSIAVLLDNSSNLTFKEDDIKTIKYKDYKKYKLSDNKSVSQYIVKNSDYKDYFDRLVVEKPGLFDIQDANTLETVQTKVKDSQLFLLFKDIYDSVVVIDEKDKNNFKQKIITIINTLYDEHDVDGSRTKINNVIKVLNDSFSDIQGKEKCERVVKFFGALAGTDLENAIKAVSSQDTDAYIYSDSYEEGKKIIEAFNLADKKVQVASKEKIEELKKIQGCLEGTAIVQADIDNKPIDDLITANKGKIFENVLNDLLDTAVGSEFASGENQDTLKTQLFSSGLIYQMNATTIGKIKGKNGPAKITTFKALNDFEDEGGNKPFINISKNVEELSYEKIFELKTNVAVISKVKEKLADTTEFGGAATDDDAKNCIEILNIIYNSGTDKEKKEPFIDISGGTKISQIKIKNAEDLKYIIDERNGAPVDFDKRLNDITTYISGENLLTILQKKVSISDLHTQLMGVLDTDDKKKTISENKKYFNNILFNTLNDVDDTNKLDKLKRSIEIATDSIILTDNFISDGVKNAIYDKGQYGSTKTSEQRQKVENLVQDLQKVQDVTKITEISSKTKTAANYDDFLTNSYRQIFTAFAKTALRDSKGEELSLALQAKVVEGLMNDERKRGTYLQRIRGAYIKDTEKVPVKFFDCVLDDHGEKFDYSKFTYDELKELVSEEELKGIIIDQVLNQTYDYLKFGDLKGGVIEATDKGNLKTILEGYLEFVNCVISGIDDKKSIGDNKEVLETNAKFLSLFLTSYGASNEITDSKNVKLSNENTETIYDHAGSIFAEYSSIADFKTKKDIVENLKNYKYFKLMKQGLINQKYDRDDLSKIMGDKKNTDYFSLTTGITLDGTPLTHSGIIVPFLKYTNQYISNKLFEDYKEQFDNISKEDKSTAEKIKTLEEKFQKLRSQMKNMTSICQMLTEYNNTLRKNGKSTVDFASELQKCDTYDAFAGKAIELFIDNFIKNVKLVDEKGDEIKGDDKKKIKYENIKKIIIEKNASITRKQVKDKTSDETQAQTAYNNAKSNPDYGVCLLNVMQNLYARSKLSVQELFTEIASENIPLEDLSYNILTVFKKYTGNTVNVNKLCAEFISTELKNAGEIDDKQKEEVSDIIQNEPRLIDHDQVPPQLKNNYKNLLLTAILPEGLLRHAGTGAGDIDNYRTALEEHVSKIFKAIFNNEKSGIDTTVIRNELKDTCEKTKNNIMDKTGLDNYKAVLESISKLDENKYSTFFSATGEYGEARKQVVEKNSPKSIETLVYMMNLGVKKEIARDLYENATWDDQENNRKIMEDVISFIMNKNIAETLNIEEKDKTDIANRSDNTDKFLQNSLELIFKQALLQEIIITDEGKKIDDETKAAEIAKGMAKNLVSIPNQKERLDAISTYIKEIDQCINTRATIQYSNLIDKTVYKHPDISFNTLQELYGDKEKAKKEVIDNYVSKNAATGKPLVNKKGNLEKVLPEVFDQVFNASKPEPTLTQKGDLLQTLLPEYTTYSLKDEDIENIKKTFELSKEQIEGITEVVGLNTTTDYTEGYKKLDEIIPYVKTDEEKKLFEKDSLSQKAILYLTTDDTASTAGKLNYKNAIEKVKKVSEFTSDDLQKEIFDSDKAGFINKKDDRELVIEYCERIKELEEKGKGLEKAEKTSIKAQTTLKEFYQTTNAVLLKKAMANFIEANNGNAKLGNDNVIVAVTNFVNTNLEKATNTHQAYKNTLSYLTDIIDKGRAVRFDNFISEIEKNIGTTNNFMDSATDDIKKVIENKEEYQKDIVGKIAGQAKYTEYKQTLTELLTNNFNTLVDNTTISSEKIKADYEPLINVILPKDEITSTATKAEDTTNITTILNEIEKQADKKDIINGLTSIFEEIKNNDEIKKSLTEQIANHSTDITKFKKDSIYQKAIVGALKANEKADNLVKNTIDMLDIEMGNLVSDTLKGLLCPADKYNDETTKKQREEALLYCNTINQINNVANRNVEIKGAAINEIKSTVSYTNFKEEATKAIVEAVVYKTITKKDSAGKPQVLSNTDETDKVFVKEIVDKINGLEGTKLQETLSYMLELAQNNVTTTVKPFQMSCSDFIANLKNKGDINIELKGVPYDKAKDILGDDVAKDNAIKELADKNTDKTKNMTAVLNAVFNNKDIVSTDKPQLEIQTPYKEFIEAILPKDDDIKDKDTTKKADDVRKDFATDLVNIFNNLTKGNEKNELDGIQTVVAAVADINKRLEIISNLSVDVNNYALFADNKKKELLKNTAKAGGKISETIKDLQQIRGTTYNVSDELLKTLYPDNETKFKEEKNHRKFVVNALKTLSVANKKGELGVESLDLVKNEKGFDDFQKTIIDTVLGNFLTKYVKVNNGKGGEIDFDCTRTHTAVYNEIKADIKDKLKDDDGTKILNFIKAIDDKCGELGAIGAASNFIRYDDFITKIYVGTIGTKPDISRGIDDALYFDPTKIKEKSYQVYKDKLEKVSTNVRYKDEFGGMSALGFKTIYNNCYDVFSTNTAFQSDEGVKFIADVFDKTKGVYTGGRKSNLGDILRKIFEVDSEVTSEFIKCYSMANAKYKYNQGNKGDVLKKTSEDMNLFDPNKPYAQIIESMITNTNTSFENAVSYATSFKEQEIKKEIIENLFPINSAEYKNKLNERSVVITLLQINEKKSEDLSAANNIKDLMEKMASTIADDISKKLTTNVRGKEGDLETDTQEAIKKVIEENIKKLPDSGDDTEKTYKVLNYYNSIISSKDKINFVDFRNNVTEKLEDIFAGQLKYDTYADIYGAKKAKDDFSEALAEKLKGDGKIKEEEKDKCTEIIKLLFDKVTEDETTSGKRQIKTAYQDFIIAVMPKTSAKYDKEQEDKLLTIVNNIEVIASPDKEVVSKGITEIFKKAKNEEEQEEFIKTISNIDPSKYVEYFKEGTANYQAIQRSIVEGRSLKDTISEVDLMKDKVSDEIKSEIYKDDNSETKAKRFTIITICNTINQIKGDKSGTIDTTELNKKTDLNNFYKEAKKIESNYIVSKLTNKNGNALESSKEPGKNLSEALQELDITVISSLAIQAQKGRISSSKDLQQYDLYVSDYTQSQSLFEVEYINKQVVKHIISGLEYTTYEETQKENLEKILTQNVTPLLSIAESKVVDDYKEFVKVLAPENEKVSDEYLGNLKGLLEKIEKNELAEPSNKEDAITFIANILEKQESLEGLNNTVKQISELSKEQFAKVLENKETVVKLVGDGVPFENANDAIVKAGELHLSKNVIKTLDRESAHSVIELSEIMETASKAPLGVKVEGADVEAKTDVKEVFEIYADAIFDKMAEHVQCKEGKEDNKLSEWGKESVHEDEYKKVKEVFRKKILNLECFNKIKQETNKFEKPITFEKLLEKVDLSGSAEISANIVENITGKKPTLEDTLSKIEELNYSKKSKEVQEIIKGLCANDEIKKQIINEDGQFIDGEQSKIILVNLIKNIPDEKEKAEEYSKNIKTIVKDFTIDALKDIYGDKESKPLTVEVVNDLSKNVADAKTQYNDNKILFKHLIQKEKTVAEIKETSEALEEIIDKSNEKLLQDICKNDKTEEIIKVSKIEESSGLTNLNSEIKSAITSKETWEDVKKTIVEKVIDKKLDILKTEDENFLKGKKEEEVRRVLKEEVLKNEELYETIINKPETIKEIKTHSDFYTKLTPPNTEVSKQVLQNVVLTADQLKNPLIKDNLSDLTKCVNRDLTIKENSVLEIISNFDEEMIQTAKAIEANVGLEYNNGTLLSKNKTVTIKQALQDIVVDAIKINPNSVSDTFKNKMQQIRENLVEYSKDKEHSAEEASKNKLSKIIESIKILQNADNLWNQPKDAKKIQNKEEFIEYLKYKKQFKNEKLLETINKIGDFFDDLKKIKNNKECANVINTIENKIKTLDDPKYQGATELLNSFIEKKKDKLDINDIIDINIQQRDTAEQAQVRMLYHIINKCKTQTEVQEILGDKKLNDTQLKNLAKLVAQDEKPSQLALQILTTPTKEVAEPDDETRKEIINILTSDKSEILSRTQYSLLHSLKNKEEYKDEKLQNFVHNKEIEILENNESLAQVRSIFSLSDTDTIYNSIIDKKLDINSEIGINDLSQSRAYSLKIAELCDHNHNTIIKTYHDFLEKSNKSSIGDDESSKEAIVNVIVSACQEDTKLFTEIMTGDTFTEENKVDLIKGKYLPQRLDCTVVETKKKQQIVVNVENTVENILQDCEQISKETTSPEDKVKNESIFVKGVNEALRYHDSDTIAQICNSIKDNIDIEEETATSLRIKGHLLSEISSRQTEQFDHIKKWVRGGNLTPQSETRSKPILEEKANDEIISNLIDIDKKIYSDDTEKDNYIPSIYHFIESIQDSDIKEKQSKKVADHIISKLSNGDIEAGEVLNILSGCKTADKEEKKSTYNAIIDGLASQAKDENVEQIQNIIKSCVNSVNKEEQDIAVDLYYKISQKQSNNLQKNNFSEQGLNKLLLETPLQTYIEREKKGDYEIITGGLLAKKQNRNVETILEKLNLSPDQIKVYKEQIALLSTPEEIFDLLNGLIKNHNTKIASGLASGHMDLLTSTDRNVIKGEFEKHDLKGLFMGKTSKEREKNKEKLYAELEERASKAGFTEKHEIRGLVKKLKRKEKEFDRARTELTKFASLHLKRAREAAEYIARYNKYNEIINNKEKYSKEERKEARRARKTLAKGNYEFMNHGDGFGRHWRKKKNPIQFIWSIFTRKSKRKLYYAKKDLERSNKALRVVLGVDFVPEFDSKKGTVYTMRTKVKPNPNETTIRSKKLRMIKQHEDAGFWSQLWGGGKARYSQFRELRVHRTGDATAMEGFTEKFIKETSDLRKEAVEILTKKNYYSKSSLGKVKTSDKEELNFIYDTAFGASKDQENENKNKGGRS